MNTSVLVSCSAASLWLGVVAGIGGSEEPSAERVAVSYTVADEGALGAGEAPGARAYCEACYTDDTDDWIAEFRFNEINNVSGIEVGGCSYGDYRDQQAYAYPGMVAPMTVGVGSSPLGGWAHCVSVWIDWNHDCVFDASERTDGECGSGPGGDEVRYTSFDVTAPADAVFGATTMRVIERNITWPPDACDSDAYGEIEDYTVVVGEPFGACCTSTGCLDDIVESDCTETFLGHRSVCDPNDCNSNGISDNCDVATEVSPDCNESAIPDECEEDCNTNGIPDDCDIADCDGSYWCLDYQMDGIPDVCQLENNDCNSNQVPDDVDIACCGGAAWCQDCQGDGVPDGCQLDNNDCNTNYIPDECEPDCNSNGIVDECDIRDCDGSYWCLDCHPDGIPDQCQLEDNDCNSNLIPDDIDVADCDGSLWCLDCQGNGVPDGCEVDPDTGQSEDCQPDGIPDECQLGQEIGGVPEEPCTAPDATITIDILADNYPGETTWTLVERGFGVVASGGPYLTPDTLYSTDVAVCSDRCYDFTIFDSYGDGICCGYGEGYYQVYVDGVLEAEGGEFGTSELAAGIGPICAPWADPPLIQPPDRLASFAADLDCDACSAGLGFAADNVHLQYPSTLGTIRFWGAYHPSNQSPDQDAFTVVIRGQAECNPGPAIATFGPMPPITKELTGETVSGVDEYVYTIELPRVSLAPGYYWFQIYNNTIDSPDTWRWETGQRDMFVGLMGMAYTFTVPEECWYCECEFDLAWELHPSPGPMTNDCNTNGVPDECELICDFDADGLVDGADYQTILASCAHIFGDEEYQPCADFDDDGTVSLADYQEWLMCYRAASGMRTPAFSPGIEETAQSSDDTGTIGSPEAVRR